MLPSSKATDQEAWEELKREAGAVTDHGALQRLLRRLSADASAADRCPKRTRILLGGNCTTAFLSSAVHVALFGRGIWSHHLEAGYDQWIREALDPDSEIRRFQADISVIWLSTLGMSRGGTARLAPDFESIESAVDALRHGGAKVVLLLPEPMPEEDDQSSPWVEWRREILATIRSRLSEKCLLVETGPVLRRLGGSSWYAARYWMTSKLPCHPNASAVLGQEVGAVIAQVIAPAVKLVISDLDNTLWGGIVGELGASGVDLDQHGNGAAYLRLQRLLKDAYASGIAVAIASKNNEEDALEVFETRPEMILKREDLAAYRINWDDKYKNILDLAETLNLGLQSICFLDDNPAEREAVRQSLPEVIVPDLPRDAEEVVPFLVRTHLLERPVRTKEDLERNEYYKQDEKRRKLQAAAFNVDDYLRSLEQTLRPLPVDERTLGRVESLVNKTNQFNLTTRRHGAVCLAAWGQSSDAYAFCFEVSDRFGDAGIVGVLIAVPEGQHAVRVDTWLLSCRVMGRTVELAMFEHLLGWCRGRLVRDLYGEFIPTRKNRPVENLYGSLGFTMIKDDAATGGRIYRAGVESLPARRHHVQVLPSDEHRG